jgi:ABC-type transport system substrate-binding protein
MPGIWFSRWRAAGCLRVAAHGPPIRARSSAGLSEPERGFDCARESDELTGMFCDNIYDALLQYDHLARPIKLQPRAAAAMPEISADGRTYTIRIRPGIYFTPDPAFAESAAS